MHLLKIEFERNLKIEIISGRKKPLGKLRLKKEDVILEKEKKKVHGANLKKNRNNKSMESISFCNFEFRVLWGILKHKMYNNENKRVLYVTKTVFYLIRDEKTIE